MNIDKAAKVFPNFFSNFDLPEGAKKQEIEVYRMCLTGIINREAFYGSYEAHMKGISYNKNITENSTDPGDYSTSCFEDEKDAKRFKKLFSRHKPELIVAKGSTNKECGPCQRTKDRDSKVKNSHVDWWIYENANPQQYFKEVTI